MVARADQGAEAAGAEWTSVFLWFLLWSRWGFLTARRPRAGSWPAHAQVSKASVRRETSGRCRSFYNLPSEVTSLPGFKGKKHRFHLLMTRVSKSQMCGRCYCDYLWRKPSATQMMMNPVISCTVIAPC